MDTREVGECCLDGVEMGGEGALKALWCLFEHGKLGKWERMCDLGVMIYDRWVEAKLHPVDGDRSSPIRLMLFRQNIASAWYRWETH